MFLLFSCSGARAARLLDEEESGTLGRLIGSRAGMTGVLAGKWLFLVIMGVIQLTVMFVWGAVMFGLPLSSHLPGFFTMTVFTACAAAALRAIARDDQPFARAVVRYLDHRHSRDVGRRRQHVPAFPDDREACRS